MPIVAVTKQTKTKGSRGIITAIAKAINVSPATVSRVNSGKKTSARVQAALNFYQRTGRMPEAAQ